MGRDGPGLEDRYYFFFFVDQTISFKNPKADTELLKGQSQRGIQA